MNRNIVVTILLSITSTFPLELWSQHYNQDSLATPKGKFTIVENSDIRQLNEIWKREQSVKTLQGYRIQLYNGSKTQAFEIRSRFMKVFPDEASTIVYETPEYKTQVGNYRSRLEAQHALSQIRQEFKGAFLVKTQIDLPNLKAIVKE